MKYVLPMISVLFLLLYTSCSNKSDTFGKVTSLTGDVSVYNKIGKNWEPLKKSSQIHYGDTIQTKNGSLEIRFKNKSKLTLQANTKIIVVDSVSNKNWYISPIVFSGGILSEVKHSHPNDFTYIVYTPVSYAEGQGTTYFVSFNPNNNSSDVYSFEGNVVVYNIHDLSTDPVVLAPGFTTSVVYSDLPRTPQKLHNEQFKRVGYMFTPDECKQYEVTFNFPVVPIPVPTTVFVPVALPTIPEPEVVEERPIDNPPPERIREHHHHDHRSNVSVSVSVNAPIPPIPFIAPPIMPVPVVPVPVPAPVPVPVPVPGHHFHMGAPVPGPVVAPVPVPVPAPVPVPGLFPVPHRHHGSENHNDDNDNHGPKHPPVPFPVPFRH